MKCEKLRKRKKGRAPPTMAVKRTGKPVRGLIVIRRWLPDGSEVVSTMRKPRRTNGPGHARAERHYCAKLTADQVRAAREQREWFGASVRGVKAWLLERFGLEIGKTTVERFLSYETWDVPEAMPGAAGDRDKPRPGARKPGEPFGGQG